MFLTHHKLSFCSLRKGSGVQSTRVPYGTWMRNSLAETWGCRQNGTWDTLANLMEARQHLTRTVGTVPGSYVRPCPEESWVRGEVTLSISFKFAISTESKTQSKIRYKHAESRDLSLEDKDLWSLELLQRNTGERKSFSADLSMFSFPGLCGEDLQDSLCGWQIFWSTLEIFLGRMRNAPATPTHGLG